MGDAQDDRLRLRAQETLQTVHGSPWCGRRSRTSCSTRATAARRRGPSCARPAPRDSYWRSPYRNPLEQKAAHWPEPECCSAVPRAVTNTGDRGYRPDTGNARGSRSSTRPSTARSATLSVSTTATWSRTAVIHGATVFSVLLWPIFLLTHVHRVHHTATPVVRLRVACLLQVGTMPDEGDAFAPGDTRVGRQRFAMCDGFGAVQHRREERFDTPRSLGTRGINGAPDLPLGGSSFHHPLAFSCRRGPQTVPGWHPRPHVLVQPADVVLRAEVPASLQTVLHERHVAPDKPLLVAQQPIRYLPRRHGLHHARAWLRGNAVTGAVLVEGHVLRKEPARCAHGRPGETAVPAALSVPFNLLPEGRNAEVAQLAKDDSEQGTRRRL